MVSKDFAVKHKLYVKKMTEQQAQDNGVKIGNGMIEYPIGYTQIWSSVKGARIPFCRKITAMVMPNLPEQFIVGLKDIKCFGILPPKWPEIEPDPVSQEEMNEINRLHFPLSDDEKFMNGTLLYLQPNDHDDPDPDDVEQDPTSFDVPIKGEEDVSNMTEEQLPLNI